MKRFLTVAGLILALGISAYASFTQEAKAHELECGLIKDVYQLLSEQYNEVRVGEGLKNVDDLSMVVEIWQGPESYTILITNLRLEAACIINTGYDLVIHTDKVNPEPQPSESNLETF